MTKHVVNEEYREIAFINNKIITLKNVVEVDTSGTFLRITTKTHYYLINPNHVLWHEIPVISKIF